MESCAAAERWLCNRASGVSCHYLVDRDGTIAQMVGEEMRAWHAGVSFWAGESDCNSRSIGIEIHNPGHTLVYADFPPEQMRAVAALCHDIRRRHDMPQHRILAHSDVAPARKIDPGEKFDWAWLHGEGLGHWVAPVADMPGESLAEGSSGEAVRGLQAQLADYGYGVPQSGAFDRATATVVKAFQRHFRPARVDGIADPGTRDTLRRLLVARES
jgi:N-acetylmuramoyl-L-alanine amidase